MTSEVKATSSDKNIDIQINIENNLFSKNKCDGLCKTKQGKQDNVPRIQTKLGELPPTDILDAIGGEAEGKLFGAIHPNNFSAGTFRNRLANYSRNQQQERDATRWMQQVGEEVGQHAFDYMMNRNEEEIARQEAEIARQGAQIQARNEPRMQEANIQFHDVEPQQLQPNNNNALVVRPRQELQVVGNNEDMEAGAAERNPLSSRITNMMRRGANVLKSPFKRNNRRNEQNEEGLELQGELVFDPEQAGAAGGDDNGAGVEEIRMHRMGFEGNNFRARREEFAERHGIRNLREITTNRFNRDAYQNWYESNFED